MKNTFVVSCPIDTYSGYGARSRDFVKSLVELDKYNVKILAQRWGQCAWGFINDHKEEWGFLESLITDQLTQQPDIWCQISVPNEFQKVGKYNIGLTAGIETTICAPQNPQGQVVGQLKLEKPIQVLMEGANLDIYKPLSRKDLEYKDLFTDINSIPEDFAFLFVGHWMQGNIGEDRKNVGLLIKAFYEMYKNKKKTPALILKTSITNASNVGRREILQRINTIRNSVPAKRLPNVYLLHGDFSNEEMNELYNHPKIKAMVSLTKGEGFGRPLLEFSLTNKPIIASNWSGQTDFLNPEYTALVNGSLKPIHKSAQIKDLLVEKSQWFAPDLQHTFMMFNNVFTNYKEWKVKGKRQGYYSRTNFSFDKMKEILGAILDKNIPQIAQQVTLKLPKLKKVNNKPSELPKLKLPKLKKVTNKPSELPKLKLPKLKKVTNG